MNWEPFFALTAYRRSLGPAVGLLLMARYVYSFFFGDEDVSDRVVTQAKDRVYSCSWLDTQPAPSTVHCPLRGAWWNISLRERLQASTQTALGARRLARPSGVGLLC